MNCRSREGFAEHVPAKRFYRSCAEFMEDPDNIGGGLSEMRIDHGPGYRVYFMRRRSIVIVLLCGGDKTTQQRDIEQAKALAAEWKD